jgi:hypothetical protein
MLYTAIMLLQSAHSLRANVAQDLNSITVKVEKLLNTSNNNPSQKPSIKPSQQPSIMPSWMPSFESGNQTTAEPSVEPSSEPSVEPSGMPTSKPSMRPKSVVTLAPLPIGASDYPTAFTVSFPITGLPLAVFTSSVQDLFVGAMASQLNVLTSAVSVMKVKESSVRFRSLAAGTIVVDTVVTYLSSDVVPTSADIVNSLTSPSKAGTDFSTLFRQALVSSPEALADPALLAMYQSVTVLTPTVSEIANTPTDVTTIAPTTAPTNDPNGQVRQSSSAEDPLSPQSSQSIGLIVGFSILGCLLLLS